MQYIIWALHMTMLFFCVYADHRKPSRFQCPREYERNVGCVYKGNFIDEARCLELCRDYSRHDSRDPQYEVRIQAICENNEECECRLPPGPGIDNPFGIIMDLSELEEDRALTSNPPGRRVETADVRCGYRDELITVEDCLQKCTTLQISRENNPTPLVHCEMNLRCKCEDIDEDESYFIDLDILEAQWYYELEKDIAINVRFWLEIHNGVNGLWCGIASPVQLLK